MIRRIHRGLPGSVAFGALLALGGCGVDSSGTEDVEAPDFEARSLDGETVALSDFTDEVVLLNIWATWCPPCREEMPDLQQLHEELHEDGLQVVGVSIDGRGSDDGVRHFIEEFGVGFTILRDPSDEVSRAFGARGVPASFIIDSDGMIRWRHLGPVTADDPDLRATLDRTLPEAW